MALQPYSQRVADIPPERVEWLSMSRIAVGKITVLDGDPGLGKSTVVIDWVARLTRGDPLPYGPRNKPRGVIILSAEDGKADTIRPRLEAAGADLSRVYLFEMRDEEGDGYLPNFPENIGSLENHIVATDSVMVVIDPLVAYMSGTLSANRDQDVRRMMSPLASMMERARAACIVIRHLNKDEGKASLYRGGGSIGIIGAARFGLVVAKDPEDESGARRILAIQKANIGRDDEPSLTYTIQGVEGTDVAKVVWGDESSLRANDLMGRQESNDEKSKVDEAKEWLIGELGGGSVAVTQLRKMARDNGFGWRTVQTAKSRTPEIHAGKVGFADKTYWVWSLGKPEA